MPMNDRQNIREDVLYPLDNPDFAFRNSMQDVGLNPYAANPFTQSMKRLAPSLGAGYKLRQATDARNTPYAVTNRGSGGPGSTMTFSDYLFYNLTGNDRDRKQKYPESGPLPMDGIYSTGSQHVAGTQNLINKVRGYRNDLGAGRANFSNTNPFLVAMSDQLGANGGLGTASFLSDMMTPYLSPAMASSYSRFLNTAGEQSIRKLGNEPFTSQNDIWTHMLGY